MMSKACFRVDASILIGNGHVMRCLTLADALTKMGVTCKFICRQHAGNLINLIRNKNYIVYELPLIEPNILDKKIPKQIEYLDWLGTTQEIDARQCHDQLENEIFDWLVVDHYALDSYWELFLKKNYKKLLVIDDLANRDHFCNILLDQNLGRFDSDYRNLIPVTTELLCGPEFALIRPEFNRLRETSLSRRAKPLLKKILISMGGVDKDNASLHVLQSLEGTNLPPDCQITVVLGTNAPWLDKVVEQSIKMKWQTKVLVNIHNMAHEMYESDLIIGAAGSTSWERCSLGVPTIILPLAENQVASCQAISNSGAAWMIKSPATIKDELPIMINRIIKKPDILTNLTNKSKIITEGKGIEKIINLMFKQNI